MYYHHWLLCWLIVWIIEDKFSDVSCKLSQCSLENNPNPEEHRQKACQTLVQAIVSAIPSRIKNTNLLVYSEAVAEFRLYFAKVMHTKVLLSKTDMYRKHQRDVKTYIHLVQIHPDTEAKEVYRSLTTFKRVRQCGSWRQYKYLKMWGALDEIF